MERITKDEWRAVMSGLEREARECWEQARFAWDANAPEFVPGWVQRIKVAKCVYDRLWLLPIVPDEPDEEPYDEPYEPVYQEPDSFYTYEEQEYGWV